MKARLTRRMLRSAVAAWAVLALTAAAAWAARYDPLALAPNGTPRVLDTSARDGSREIPLRLYLPPKLVGPTPIVLFSHGLGGSREGNAYCGRHWASRGYVAVFLQHPGSDASIWQDVPREQRLEAMRGAANASNFVKRASDVSA